MTPEAEQNVPLKVERDIVAARQAGRGLARNLGFGLGDQTRLATAISELARNVIQYAGEGVCRIQDVSDRASARVQVTVEDHGPGIADIELALTDGYSTGGGLGAGLPGTKRLMHEFGIESEAGHTKISIAISQRKV